MWPSVFREQENRVYDLPSCLLKDRYILINQEIDDEFASSVVAQLLFLESEQPDAPIKMIINSPGGSISAGMAIYDTLNNVKCPIITIANGMAASMAAFLLCSGSKGKRYAMPNSTIMIHQPLGGVQGQATEIEIVAKRILGLREKLYTIMAENTNGKTSYEEMAKACERDNYLTPEEALEMGLIDEVIKTPNKATM